MKNLQPFILRTVLAVFVIANCLISSAQFTYNYVKAGDDYFRKGDYYSAAMYYEKFLNSNASSKKEAFDPYAVASGSKGQKTKTTNRNEVIYRSGESYRMLNNPVKAEPFYKEAMTFNGFYPLARYWYAKTLRANSKFEEAETEFNTFLAEYATNDSYKSDADKELKNLQFRKAQLERKDLNLYSVSKMAINTAGANSAPVVFGNNLYFNSTRIDENSTGKNPYINRIYETGLTDGGGITKVNIPQENDEHFERPSFSADGQKMYVTKWVIGDSKKSAAIFLSMKNGESWTEPVLLAGSVNTDGYSSQQPFVSPDGKYLYFASDKPGGFGKMDLYVTTLDADGNPGEANNLGGIINTADDDLAPFYFGPAQTLVFSTNGRIGMGGFDFFQAKGSGSSWEEAVNLGSPINSVKDDIYMASAGSKHLLDTIYFSSDRGSDCCLELFTANKIRPRRNISGKIIDCLTAAPMADVTITASDPDTEAPVTSGTTDAFGRYLISIDQEQQIKVLAEHEGYTPKSVDLSKVSPTDTLINISVCLEPPQKPFEPVEDKPAVIPNIYFDYDKATLRPESFPVLDSVVGLMERYPNMAIEVGGHTDNIAGEDYNQKLSEARAKAFVDYVVSKGIDASRMQWKGYGESQPIAPNTIKNKDNPEGRQKNRRTEIKVTRY